MNALLCHKRTGGFTLIELLVVMGVIAILVALIVPTIGRARQQVHARSVRLTIDSLSNALEKYKSVYLRYPPDRHPQLTRSSQCLIYYLSGASIYYDTSMTNYPWKHNLYRASGRDDIEKFPVHHDFGKNLLKDFGDRAPALIDPWQHTIIYNSGSSSNGSYNRYNSAKHGERKFDLFSAGPDGEYGTPDDITNWDDSFPWGYDKDENGASLGLDDGTH